MFRNIYLFSSSLFSDESGVSKFISTNYNYLLIERMKRIASSSFLKDRPEVRVIFVSGYAEEDFPDAQSRIAQSVFLPKPFTLNDLAETVQRQMV